MELKEEKYSLQAQALAKLIKFSTECVLTGSLYGETNIRPIVTLPISIEKYAREYPGFLQGMISHSILMTVGQINSGDKLQKKTSISSKSPKPYSFKESAEAHRKLTELANLFEGRFFSLQRIRLDGDFFDTKRLIDLYQEKGDQPLQKWIENLE